MCLHTSAVVILENRQLLVDFVYWYSRPEKKNEPCIKQENLPTIWKRLQCCKLFSSETTFTWNVDHEALDLHCPWRNKQVALVNQTPWISNAILKQLRLRDTLLKKAKRSKDPSDWAEYRKARNKAVGLLKSAKWKYYVSKLENNQNNAKELWKTVKSISGLNKQSTCVSSLKAGEHVLEDNEQMASEFNSYFTSIADQLRSSLPQTSLDISKLIHFVDSRKDAGITFSIPPITESKVIDCLKNTCSNKASGIDKLSAQIVHCQVDQLVIQQISFSSRLEDCQSLSII